MDSSYIKQLEEDNEKLRNLLATKQTQEDKLETLQKYEKLFLFIKNHMTSIDIESSYDSLKTRINMALDVYDDCAENKKLIKEFYDTILGRTFSPNHTSTGEVS